MICELEQVDDISALALSGHTRNIIDLQPVALSAIGKYKQIIVCRCDKQMFYEVALFRIRADYSSAAATLSAVGVNRHSFYVSVVTDCNNNFLFGNQIFDFQLFNFSCDLRPPFVTVFFFYFMDIFANDIHQNILVSQYCFETLYLLGNVGVFFGQLFHFQAGQSLKLHR